MGDRNINMEIIEVKAEVFDLLKRQSSLQIMANQLEKVKQEKLKKLAELEKELHKANGVKENITLLKK